MRLHNMRINGNYEKINPKRLISAIYKTLPRLSVTAQRESRAIELLRYTFSEHLARILGNLLHYIIGLYSEQFNWYCDMWVAGQVFLRSSPNTTEYWNWISSYFIYLYSWFLHKDIDLTLTHPVRSSLRDSFILAKAVRTNAKHMNKENADTGCLKDADRDARQGVCSYICHIQFINVQNG